MNLPRSSDGGIGWRELDLGVVLCFFETCFLGAMEDRDALEEMGGWGGTVCGKGKWSVRSK